jgi:hypothetical protein
MTTESGSVVSFDAANVYKGKNPSILYHQRMNTDLE